MSFAAGPVPPVGGGFGFPGFGKGFSLDVDAGGGAGAGGFGFPGLLGGGGGFPGWGGPYVPITPLGALGGLKGDLIVPIVAIGVALFLLVLIVLAVKYALAWKLSLLEDLSAGPRKFRRDVGSAAAPQLEDDYMIQLAKIVTSAIYSGSCSDRMICEVGAIARGNAKTLSGLLSLVESYIPSSYTSYLDIMKSSAEGSFDCAQKYQCAQDANKSNQQQSKIPQQPTTPMPNSFQGQVPNQTPRPQLQDLFNGSATNEVRPVQRPSKFRRGLI